MTRRWLKTAAFLLFINAVSAVEPDRLPEVLATYDGTSIRRDELAPALTRQLAALKLPEDADKIRKLVRREVDNAICRRMLGAMLGAAQLTPSRELALRYINESLRPLAPAAKLILERELMPQADDPEFQLKAATHLFLLTRFAPAFFEIPPEEIERCYMLNKENYRRPDKLDVGVIRIDRKKRGDAAEAAEEARARLLQGESFDRVAKEFSPEGGEKDLPPEKVHNLFASELSRLSAGDVSPVLKDADAFYVLLVRDKRIGGSIPLNEAEPYIRMELSALRDALALRRVLAGRFATSKIDYTPLELEK